MADKLFERDEIVGPYHASRLEWPGSAAYHRNLNIELLSHLPADRHLMALDNMCGIGVLLPDLAGRYDRVVGSDISPKVLSFARRHESRLVQSDALALPFKNDCFDVVIVRGGLHHVDDVPKALGEIRRTLKPGGLCAMLEPRDDNPLLRWLRSGLYRFLSKSDPDEQHGMRTRAFRRVVGEAGLRVIHEEPYGLIGFALFCNPDTIPLTKGFSFIPGAPGLARMLGTLDRWLNRLPIIRSFAFETLLVASRPV